ncbi:hypothetical protein Sa4125_21480 [Aureimonas sp. SA4125]|uniref:FAD:protein FMN transferase n=1 Tax=Aureimonas sp. SA4125 TaxID=2826993 RepID=UPI001CC35477|nr:FAD:protein FMN transferase [Aureimonas sp. SA4125]BDA84606.1 hypothetical protein Sa4125_21480 [Aureimonas sp. SA4125]
MPLRSRVASVTVVAATTMEADALATALMVVGADTGASVARDQRIDALFMLREGAGIREIGCGRFASAPAVPA